MRPAVDYSVIGSEFEVKANPWVLQELYVYAKWNLLRMEKIWDNLQLCPFCSSAWCALCHDTNHGINLSRWYLRRRGNRVFFAPSKDEVKKTIQHPLASLDTFCGSNFIHSNQSAWSIVNFSLPAVCNYYKSKIRIIITQKQTCLRLRIWTRKYG